MHLIQWGTGHKLLIDISTIQSISYDGDLDVISIYCENNSRPIEIEFQGGILYQELLPLVLDKKPYTRVVAVPFISG